MIAATWSIKRSFTTPARYQRSRSWTLFDSAGLAAWRQARAEAEDAGAGMEAGPRKEDALWHARRIETSEAAYEAMVVRIWSRSFGQTSPKKFLFTMLMHRLCTIG